MSFQESQSIIRYKIHWMNVIRSAICVATIALIIFVITQTYHLKNKYEGSCLDGEHSASASIHILGSLTAVQCLLIGFSCFLITFYQMFSGEMFYVILFYSGLVVFMSYPQIALANVDYSECYKSFSDLKYWIFYANSFYLFLGTILVFTGLYFTTRYLARLSIVDLFIEKVELTSYR